MYKISNKKLGIIFEKAISNMLTNNSIGNLINSFNGIDIFIPKYNLFLEVKTCYRYKKRSNSNKILQCQFGIKTSQIAITDYYIFIILHNRPAKLNYIKKIEFRVINKLNLNIYLFNSNKYTDNYRTFLSYKQLNCIQFYDLMIFIKKLNKANFIL